MYCEVAARQAGMSWEMRESSEFSARLLNYFISQKSTCLLDFVMHAAMQYPAEELIFRKRCGEGAAKTGPRALRVRKARAGDRDGRKSELCFFPQLPQRIVAASGQSSRI